jgi:Protein of unknown function (DUF1838)
MFSTASLTVNPVANRVPKTFRHISAMLVAATLTMPALAVDTTSAAGQLDTYIRMRGSNDGKDVFANWWVTVFAVMPGEKPRPIFKLDGYNVGRFAKLPDGSAQLITREVAYYKDLASGQIMAEWQNPFTNEKNAVMQVANDPVNSRYAAPKAGEAGRLPFRVSGNDVMLLLDVPLAYPNALLPAEFPAESSGPTYFASEHFSFFSRAADLDDAKQASVPLVYQWNRTGPWLPWMKMGTRPGYLLYSGHGKKFMSFDELPADVREFTKANFPKYQTSPSAYETPNETSWTYYKKQMQAKKDAAK